MHSPIFRRLVVVAVAVSSATAALLLGVVPFQGWLEQRDRNTSLLIEIEGIEASNEGDEARIDALGTDEEIERLAREEYGLVRPDEEAYAVQSGSRAELDIPDVWPFSD